MQDARSTLDKPVTAHGVRIVGLGASAGGLEPLERFLSNVPTASGLAYMVVQHMDATHKTTLPELLQRATQVPVHEAIKAKRIEPDSVYVIPPNSELTLVAGGVRLVRPAKPRGQRLQIDVLFGSLARKLGDQALGVVLSGLGSDGAHGLQAIKSQGGLTLAQEPESAQFDSMPRSAIAAGFVDIDASPADMPMRIAGVVGAHPATELPSNEPLEQAEAPLETILALLHEHTRHGLTLYKSNTLVRRIARRTAIHGLASMAEYADCLGANPQEMDLLFKEMLIGVTSFFRDREVWQDLQDKVLPGLLDRHAGDSGSMRAWVVGCSTGEEAYSLGIAFVEALQSRPASGQRQQQIYATDLSADAIATARAGRFAKTIARDIEPPRFARFFSERPDGYQIDRRVRDMVLFSQHDVIMDPPFTRLDILSCRNLMIYFDSSLQKRLMPLFHYSLRPGGALLLGGSEAVGRSHALFVPLEQKSRLYWRSDNGGGRGTVVFPTDRRPVARSALQETPQAHINTPAANLQTLADYLLLQAYSPAAVLVSDAGDIVYINGRTGRYLEPAAGNANWNTHVMARQAIRAQLAVALRTALQQKNSIELRALRLDDEATTAVDITMQEVLQTKSLAGMAMIVFRGVPAKAVRRGRRTKLPDYADPRVADERLRLREEITALGPKMRTSQEELQAANEELQSANEELQSANDELMTSKEEAQSIDEELQTINSELQNKLDDLALAQCDVQSRLNSTDIATLFLDNQLKVRHYTEQIARIVRLREGDISRPLGELTSTLLYPERHADVKQTLCTLAFSEKQIATSDGHWSTVRIMPYRTLANVIQGVVITFVEVTLAKELKSRLRKAYSESLVSHS